MSDGDTIKGAFSRFYLQAPFPENKTSPLNQTAISAACRGFFFFALKRRKWKICEHLLSWNDTAAWTCTTGTFQTEWGSLQQICVHKSLCVQKILKWMNIFFPFQSLSSVLQRLYSLVLLKHQLTTVYTICHPWRWTIFLKFILFVKTLLSPF